MSTLSTRKVLAQAAFASILLCSSGAVLVATSNSSPAHAQAAVVDLTGSEEKEKIDKLQHAIDPAHYPAPKPTPAPSPSPKPTTGTTTTETGFWQSCWDAVCSFFGKEDEAKEQAAHNAEVRRLVEERAAAEKAAAEKAAAEKAAAAKTPVKQVQISSTAVKQAAALNISKTVVSTIKPTVVVTTTTSLKTPVVAPRALSPVSLANAQVRSAPLTLARPMAVPSISTLTAPRMAAAALAVRAR